jgi:hypothetical protein
MEFPLNERKQKMLEEYLQDLLFGAERKEDLELLVEILLTLRGADTPNTRGELFEGDANSEVHFRCHLYKMSPDGILWIGFVKGTGKSKEILPSLRSETRQFLFSM